MIIFNKYNTKKEQHLNHIKIAKENGKLLQLLSVLCCKKFYPKRFLTLMIQVTRRTKQQ